MSAQPADLALISDQYVLNITVPRDRLRWKLSNATDLYTETGLAPGMVVSGTFNGRVVGFAHKPERKTGKPKLTFVVEVLEAEVNPA
jgi:hypothetical protein